MRRPSRVVLALALALGLAPGIVWRSGPPRSDDSQSMAYLRLPVPTGEEARIGGSGSPVITGAWRMESPNTQFGSYSALLATHGWFLSFSDQGGFLRAPLPGRRGSVEIGRALSGAGDFKQMQDIESATADPKTGRIWLGLEGRNAIIRLEADLSGAKVVQPAAMRHWQGNGGPESLLRLDDGRFLVLAESALSWKAKGSPALLFPGDPVEGAVPEEFLFSPPEGYLPTDMKQLPDGRVLILLRGIGLLPPRFTAKLVLADPARIRAGQPWPWREVGTIERPFPLDNYEGLEVTGGEDGAPLTLWIISDDNAGELLQHNVLLRLSWPVPSSET
ncbi:esterase-like activity of phytase family protein [Altererythrobacter sp. CC-YST694]|uniref:esterase-like activity of phytase family protein n=1 Tax=Altererythrobacter sp. CC-YST694 TaxID=2755038 RepID=UPI001D0133BB|nr:esterase-like activity of phytase family protein [Altererythrobacter sp. CC-YST694]MCB5425430.1 esterase-like activity of phytase family protein [Altererythrobacter sp. CC-YST694]